MKAKKIVVIEDEADILEVVEYNLIRNGFKVASASDGDGGLRLVQEVLPDLVLLDLMLPGLDGTEICRHLTADPTTRDIPIIILTAKGEESDVVLGLGLGADDYVTKPFSPRELLARIQAVLRRGPVRAQTEHGERITRNGLSIDAGRHLVQVNGQNVDLTATEFRLIHFLASHPGRVFERHHLLSRTIAHDALVLERNVDVHIRSVRKKLGECSALIETVRGVGYRFRES